jgi:hypothetical protein
MILEEQSMSRWAAWMAWGLLLVAAATGTGCGRTNDTANMTEVQRLKSGTLDVVLLSPHETLRHGKDAFTVEFRSASDGTLIDVGDVRVSATMPMAQMPMFGTIQVQRTSVPGRYAVSSDLGMAGSWRMTIEWNGAKGSASVSFTGSVQ